MALFMLIDGFAQLLPEMLIRDEKARAAAKLAIHGAMMGAAAVCGDLPSIVGGAVLTASEGVQAGLQDSHQKAVVGAIGHALSGAATGDVVEIVKVAGGAGVGAAIGGAAGGVDGAAAGIGAGAQILGGTAAAILAKTAAAGAGAAIGASAAQDGLSRAKAIRFGIDLGTAVGGGVDAAQATPDELKEAGERKTSFLPGAPPPDPVSSSRTLAARCIPLAGEVAGAGAGAVLHAARRKDGRDLMDALDTGLSFGRTAASGASAVDADNPLGGAVAAVELGGAATRAVIDESLGARLRSLQAEARRGSRVARHEAEALGREIQRAKEGSELAERAVHAGASAHVYDWSERFLFRDQATRGSATEPEASLEGASPGAHQMPRGEDGVGETYSPGWTRIFRTPGDAA